MGLLLGVHHIGTLLLLVTAILLLVASISSPVVNNLALLKVTFRNGLDTERMTFGSFGYCQMYDGQSDYCQRHIGYNPLRLITGVDSEVDNGSVGRNTASGLTRVMVLHPVGAVLSFLAFLLAVLGTHVISSLVASLLSGLTFIVVVVALACDWTALSIVHHRVNEVRNNHATYGSALWCVVAALVTSFFATIIVLLSCCASKRSKNKPRDVVNKQEAGFADSTVPKKKFWQRR
ncbi:Signal transduction response regulator [Cordyceps militaris CM01]|uniref:Signal transduction response regulator n=1 Tax=Cordyceps militaris (strain CM01) TaxID=983644 RepID=G3JR58_CORMM|nr:Signal transduction response regulator [Cordyceps militaris CM01]EGX88354.1 Signal transduction response regulator [Cordyceps militaris CM01]